MLKFPCTGNRAFENALRHLHNTHHDLTTVSKTINAFTKEFNGYLFLDETWLWDYFAFANEHDATMFMLRFS